MQNPNYLKHIKLNNNSNTRQRKQQGMEDKKLITRQAHTMKSAYQLLIMFNKLTIPQRPNRIKMMHNIIQ